MPVTFFAFFGRGRLRNKKLPRFYDTPDKKIAFIPMRYRSQLAFVICLLNINCAYANDSFAFDVSPDNTQTEKRYVGKQTSDFLSIYDTELKKTIWKVSRGGGTLGNLVWLVIGPNAHYAVVSWEYGEAGQDLYWLDLTGGSKGSVTEIDIDALTGFVAKALKVPEDYLFRVYYDPKIWLRDNTCALVWDCTAPGKNGDWHLSVDDVGIVLLSFDPAISKKLVVTVGKSITDMSDEESYTFDSSTLFKSGRPYEGRQ